jgi:hypothetical protein
MNRLAICFLAFVIISATAWTLGASSSDTQNAELRSPILVELFTSEGCSSCPPADAFLEQLDKSQPIAGAELIVLSEHVDYWNHDGWRDPFSSSLYSERQNAYAVRFHLDGPYTPEMVVDGGIEFVGSDVRLAERAFGGAENFPKIGIRLSNVILDATNTLGFHIETDALPSSSHSHGAEVYAAIVIHHAESDVLRGENAGHHLAHTNVVEHLQKLGSLLRGHAFSKDVTFKIKPGADKNNLQFVAFIQEPYQGKVLGATVQSIEAKK